MKEVTVGSEKELLMQNNAGSEKKQQSNMGSGKEVLVGVGSQKELHCQYCNKVFYKQKNLKIHMCIHTGEKKLQCNTCGKCFIQSCHLKRHLRSHSGEKPYSCDICGNQFTQNGHLRVHLKSHFGNKSYKCEFCTMSFIQNSQLKRHMRSHMTIRPYKCHLCDKTYKFSDHLFIHLRRHTGETPYRCTYCNKAFHTSANLNAHIRIHSKYVDRKFKCHVCVKKFHTNYALVKHMAVHSSDMPFSCHLCTKSFKYKGNLKHHFDVHSEEVEMKTSKCTICGKCCASFASLKDHMLTHYEDSCNVHKCEICAKGFRVKSSVQMHQSLHTGMKLAYRCLETACEFESGTVDEMKTHVNAVHNIGKRTDTEEEIGEEEMTDENLGSGPTGEFKCPMECGDNFVNIGGLIEHLKCHIKIDKTGKAGGQRSSSIGQILTASSPGLRQSTGGGIDTKSQTQTFSESQRTLDKPSMHSIIPVKQTMEESGIGNLMVLNLVNDKDIERLRSGHCNYAQVSDMNRGRLILTSDQLASSHLSLMENKNDTFSSGVSLSRSDNATRQTPRMTLLPSNETLVHNVYPKENASRSLLRNTPTSSTVAVPISSSASYMVGTGQVSQSTFLVGGQTSQSFVSRGQTSDSLVTTGQNGQTFIYGGQGSHSVGDDGQMCQSLIVGQNTQSLILEGNVIRMLDNSDGSACANIRLHDGSACANIRLHDENMQEIIVDERTMQELVVGTTEVPISVISEDGSDNSASGVYELLSVGEVVIPTDQREDNSAQVTYQDVYQTEFLSEIANEDIACPTSTFLSIQGPNEVISSSNSTLLSVEGGNVEKKIISSNDQQSLVSNEINQKIYTCIQDESSSITQHVPYSGEGNLEMMDHRYVMPHRDNTCTLAGGKDEGSHAPGQIFIQADKLIEEINQKSHSEGQKEIGNDQGSYQCPFCSDRFQEKSWLKSHLQSHMASSDKLVMYMCHLCNEEFNNKDGLKVHLQSHV